MKQQNKKMTLYKLRMKHRRARRVDVEQLRQDTDAYLAENTPSKNEIDILADTWAFVAENIEREEWKTYTREDWEELERQHVERAYYTKPDLFDDILTKYERGLFTADEAQAYAKRYRKCKYRFCENVFKPTRKNQWYCPKSTCRSMEANAKIRFKKTGTYLPPYAYKDIREDTSQKNYEKYEIAFDMEESAGMFARFKYKEECGGKRDRAREDMNDIAHYKQNKEIDAETQVIRHYKPVTIKRDSSEIKVSPLFFRAKSEQIKKEDKIS
ncbi:hypothetical protein ACFFIS_04780 [Virgibacillus soli]